MAKMFGVLRSFLPDGTMYGGKASRLGETEIRAEINNTGYIRRDVKEGKTTAELTLFEDGSGKIVVSREGESTPISFSWSDDNHDLTYSVNIPVPDRKVPG